MAIGLIIREVARDLRWVQYAAVMGIVPQLKLSGNDFTNTASVFFIAYLVAEVPNGNSCLQ